MGNDWNRRKDQLHKERKILAEQMRDGMFSVGNMKRGTDGIVSHDEFVSKYDKWKEHNQKKMERWHSINRAFKQHGEEGRPHSMDCIRNNKVLYD